MMLRVVAASAVVVLSISPVFAGKPTKEQKAADQTEADQKAACDKEGGIYTKHTDGKWYCDPKPSSPAPTTTPAPGH